MSGNTFGKLFTVTTFGESHGLALGAIVDGCPPGIELSEADLQIDLDRRKPGQSRHTTQRRESDEVKILSGVFIDEETSRLHERRVVPSADHLVAVPGLLEMRGHLPEPTVHRDELEIVRVQTEDRSPAAPVGSPRNNVGNL